MYVKHVAILILISISGTTAQSISVDAGRSYPHGYSFDRNWNSDYTFGLSAQFPIFSTLHLVPYFSHSSFQFDEALTAEGPGVQNFRIHTHHVRRFGLMIRNEVPEQTILYPYVQAGLGHMVSDIEDVPYEWGYEQDPEYEGTVKGLSFRSITANLGIGMRMHFIDPVTPFFEINYIFGFPDEKDVGRKLTGGFKYIRLSFGITISWKKESA